VKPEALGRAKLGTASGGATCTVAAECRSGVCTGGRCLDTCCADVNCAAGTTCSVASVGGHGTFACVVPPGPVDPNQVCKTNSDCRSGVCSEYSDGFSTYRRCTAACCGSVSCGAFNVPGPFGGQIPVQRVCFDDKTPAGDGTVPLCVEPKQGNGTGAVGDPCRTGGDCYSDRCASNKLCTDVCCVDTDCGRPGWVCRPVQGTFLRCVPAQ
jgi:hypothetical protein